VFRWRCTGKAIGLFLYVRGMGTEDAPSVSGCTCSAVANAENEVGE
jgi:hypothetical protein